MKAGSVASAGTERPLFGTNEQSLLALVKASPLGIIAIDLDGRILLWNRAAEEITGWPEEEVLGLPVWVIADDSSVGWAWPTRLPGFYPNRERLLLL